MNYREFRIPEEKTQEVFTLAAKLYAQHNQSYSVKELMDAGGEAQIPPEFIQKAINQIQLQEFSNQQALAKKQNNRSRLLLGSLLTGLLALGGFYLLTRNTPSQAGVGTVNPNPIQNEPIASNPPVGGNFNCKNLSLVGADLTSENLQGSDCAKANLKGAKLSGVNLQGANLNGADLSNANLKDANLKGADLAGANLNSANLNGADLNGANISNTDLRGADIRNANLNGADTANAKLDGARK